MIFHNDFDFYLMLDRVTKGYIAVHKNEVRISPSLRKKLVLIDHKMSRSQFLHDHVALGDITEGAILQLKNDKGVLVEKYKVFKFDFDDDLLFIRELHARTIKPQETETFIHAINHDVRAPARQINQFLEVLSDNYNHEAEIEELISMAKNSSDSMLSIVTGIAHLSNVMGSNLNRKPLDISIIANHLCMSIFKPDYPKTIFDVQEGIEMTVDKDMFTLLLRNLLSNAYKFSARVSEPCVTVRFDKNINALTVSDNGIGIPMDKADEIFNLFSRLDNSYTGQGIGLVIVKKVVEKHDGRVWLTSRQGTTIYVAI